jgi:hypothetical protein
MGTKDKLLWKVSSGRFMKVHKDDDGAGERLSLQRTLLDNHTKTGKI